MSVVALMTLVAAVAMPTPVGDRENWFGEEDIPQSQFSAGKNGVFYYKALVKPDGKLDSCKVIASGANKQEQATFCKSAMVRMKYHNVVDQGGGPVYMVVDENFVFVVPDRWRPNLVKPLANLFIETAALPEGGNNDVTVNIAVDRAGQLRACNAPSGAKDSTLAERTCGQLQVLWSPMPEKDSAGNPVAYIRELRVEYRPQKAG